MRLRQIGVRELARVAACDPGNLHRVLRGHRHVPLALVERLSKGLACTPDEARSLAMAALADHGIGWFAEALAKPEPHV